MGRKPVIECKYCGGAVIFGPGFMMVETTGEDDGFVCHEECHQLSGEDEGYVERLYNELNEIGEDDETDSWCGL